MRLQGYCVGGAALFAVLAHPFCAPLFAERQPQMAASEKGPGQSSERSAELRRLSAKSEAAYKAGDLANAAIHLSAMLKLLENGANDPFGDASRVGYDLGVILDLLGRHKEAKNAHDITVAAATAFYGEEHYFTQRAKLQQANNLAELGQVTQAQERIEGLLNNPKIEGSIVASVENSYANLLDRQGRYREAETHHRTALRLNEMQFGQGSKAARASLNNLAVNLSNQGRVEEAAALQSALVDGLGEGDSVTVKATSYSSYAANLDSIGQSERAEYFHAKALELSRRSQNPATLGTTLQNYQQNQFNLGNYKESVALGEEAFAVLSGLYGANSLQVLGIRSNLSLLLMAAGRNADAAQGLSDILRKLESAGLQDTFQFRSALGNLTVAMLREPDLAPLAIRPAAQLARISTERRRAFDRDEADQNARSATDLRHRFIMALYTDAVWHSRETANAPSKVWAASDEEAAFLAMQDALISSSTRAIALRAATSFASQNPKASQLVEERFDLSQRIAGRERRIAQELTLLRQYDPNEREALRQLLRQERARLKQLDEELRVAEPRYFAWLRPEPLDFASARRVLRKDEAFVLIVPGGFATHVIAISHDDVAWHRSDWDHRRVGSAARRLLWAVGANVDPSEAEREAWDVWDDVPAMEDFDLATAHSLYQQLIAPVEHVLKGKRHVFTASPGELSTLPLGMLAMDPPVNAQMTSESLRQTRWLADAHTLIQVPSFQSLAFLRGKPRTRVETNRQRFLGVGDPELEGKSVTRGRNGTRGSVIDAQDLFEASAADPTFTLANVEKIRAMSRLPGTAQELEAMRSAFTSPRSSVLLGKAATEGALKGRKLSADVLVFATHGLLASEAQSNGEPGLVLTPPAIASIRDDGFLASSEIAALDISADWVILSACNTAAGDGRLGSSGLSGIARAFFFAGADTLLASHWPVADAVAAELTVRTVKLLEADPDLSRAQAFQLAMRAIRKDRRADGTPDTWAHPYAWAPFTLIGDGATR